MNTFDKATLKNILVDVSHPQTLKLNNTTVTDAVIILEVVNN